MLLLFQFIFNTELFRITQLQITCVLKKHIFLSRIVTPLQAKQNFDEIREALCQSPEPLRAIPFYTYQICVFIISVKENPNMTIEVLQA